MNERRMRGKKKVKISWEYCRLRHRWRGKLYSRCSAFLPFSLSTGKQRVRSSLCRVYNIKIYSLGCFHLSRSYSLLCAYGSLDRETYRLTTIIARETRPEIEADHPCRKIWSGRWTAQARNVGSRCWLSILDRWSIEAWMIIAGLYWLLILAPKSLPMIGRESLPELSWWPFKFIMILIMTRNFKT